MWEVWVEWLFPVILLPASLCLLWQRRVGCSVSSECDFWYQWVVAF